MLSRLPMTTIAASIERRGDREVVASRIWALPWHFRCTCGSSIRRRTMRYLPVFWDDNYFALLPGERREVGVSRPGSDEARLRVDGWNVQSAVR